MLKDKRGFTTLGLIAIIGLALAFLLLMLVLAYGMDKVDDAFSQIDFEIGNTSFNETYENTLKIGIVASKTTVPNLISILILLGSTISLMFVGYSTDGTNKLWLVLDVAIIIVAEIFAVAVQSSFVSFIQDNPEFQTILRTQLATSVKYITNLPIIVPVTGAIVMLATHVFNKSKRGERIF